MNANLEAPEARCSDALEVLLKEQGTDRIAELADSLRDLGDPYRFHGEPMHGGFGDGQTTRSRGT